ncbi:MAG: glycosyltransferase family 4 protein [Anaerolineae bacterium]
MNSHEPLVVFNAHLLSGDATYRSAGISVYIDSLLQHLGLEADGLRFQVLVGGGPGGADLSHLGFPALRSRYATHSPSRRILWEQTVLPGLLRRLGADLLHAPAFVGPLASGCPQVITVHDLSFLRYPQFFRPANRLYLRTMTGVACRRAAAVIAVSEFTGKEVAELLRVPVSRIHPIYHGVAPRFRPLPRTDVDEFRRRQGLPERFVLFMGTLEPRKNLIQLVRAFRKLKDPDLHLILAGAQGWFYEEIFSEVEELGLADRVHFPGFVPAEDQPFWYNAADAFAYVSVYEGFGMPVLESLACGVPAVTSSTSSMPEAGGLGALLVPPDNVDAIAEAIDRILSDEALHGELREKGLVHAAGHSWDKTARETVAVYRRAMSGGRSM